MWQKQNKNIYSIYHMNQIPTCILGWNITFAEIALYKLTTLWLVIQIFSAKIFGVEIKRRGPIIDPDPPGELKSMNYKCLTVLDIFNMDVDNIFNINAHWTMLVAKKH